VKRFLLVFLAAAIVSPAARADLIGLYSDPTGTICAAPTTPFVVHTVYVIHQFSTGATQSSWRVTNDASVMLSFGSSCGQLTIQGDAFSGITVFYPGCQTGSFLICELPFFNTSTDPVPGCYQLNVVGFNNPAPTFVDCGDNELAAAGGFFSWDIDADNCWDCTTPVESTTWGRVKSLYR